MGQWIVEQMDSISLDGAFSELSRRLLKLNMWLSRIRGDRRIAFSVVGFCNQRLLISNFLDLDGQSANTLERSRGQGKLERVVG
jgi:hypothetical protein